MRAILVGEAPTSRPLLGKPSGSAFSPGSLCGDYLGWLLAVPVRDVAETANLFDRPQRKWSPPLARTRATELRVRYGCAPDGWVLCGRRVAEAFCVEGEWLSWVEVAGRRYGLLPHPSGRNRWWNDPEHVAAARTWLREAVGERAGEPPRSRSGSKYRPRAVRSRTEPPSGPTAGDVRTPGEPE